MAKRHYSEGNYVGMDDRRRMERQDGSMLNEDRSAVANLPQEVKYHAWPSNRTYAEWKLDDTIRGIDEQESADGRGMMKHKSTKKY
jgi:hypothetical protein